MSMNNIYVRIIKEIKDLIFFLRFFNLKMIYRFFCYKIKILFNFRKYDKNFLDNNNLKFSNQWFKYNLLDWLYIFDKKINIDKNKKINILEIGSYEGQATYFFLKFFKSSSIDCVDTWQGSDEHNKNLFINIENTFDKNMSSFFNRVTKNKEKSNDFFSKNKKKFKIIYIDGSHYYKDVYRDAINAKKNLDKGGLLIFDDYLFNFYKEKNHNPITAINKFINKFGNDFSVIASFRQIFLEKN